MAEHIYVMKHLVLMNLEDIIDLYNLPTNLYYQEINYKIIDIRQETYHLYNKEYTIQRVYIKTEDSHELQDIGWVINTSIFVCMGCNKQLSWLFRQRHHCRLCGNLLCSDCLSSGMMIQNMNSLGVQIACTQCYANYKDDIRSSPSFMTQDKNGISLVKKEWQPIIETSSKIENIAAQKIINLFRSMKAMNIRKKLEAQYPSLYLISIDKLFDPTKPKGIYNDGKDVNAYVSGIYKNKNNNLETFSFSKLHMIPAMNTKQQDEEVTKEYALVACDMKLEFISISIVKANTKSIELKKKDPLGIAFLYLSDLPFRKSSIEKYLCKPVTCQLQLEPYLLPDLNFLEYKSKKLLAYKKYCMVHQLPNNKPSMQILPPNNNNNNSNSSYNPSKLKDIGNSSPSLKKQQQHSIEDKVYYFPIATAISRDDSISISNNYLQNKQISSMSVNNNTTDRLEILEPPSDDFIENNPMSIKSTTISKHSSMKTAKIADIPINTTKASVVISNEISSGSIIIKILKPNPIYSMCGWLSKLFSSKNDIYKNYWFVLINNELSYYQQECVPGEIPVILKSRKQSIACIDMLACELQDNKYIVIYYNSPEKADKTKIYSWYLCAVSPQSDKNPRLIKALARMWVRKIQRCCQQKKIFV